ncbi:serine/threonine dehydratase [Nocardioides coralli]|uniref:serine/threonine dehydratase n=1 Tax=Nocardioides coralli TaxID=2872154 RepID=UPI001CA44371|nr:serine/threonine dehydratase [Nocardioides coralli]QZY28493.1 serine/threonine dehydratase [Nocardioides coralli]
MSVPDRADILRAHELIGSRVRRTPVVEALGVTLKLELLQHAGSFKPRGAFATVLAEPEQPARLVAASGGNHGLAVAHVGATLGIPTDVFVPDIASPVKVAAIRERGATVHQQGADYAAALEASRDAAAEPGVLAIHAYDGPFTLPGQGTVALELEQQAPDLDTVVVAVGGGGLIGGIAAWYAGSGVRVVAVEPEGCPSMHDALAAGRPLRAPVGGVAADALGASQVGERGFAACRAAQVQSVLVPDEAILGARRRLWSELRVVAEPAGATALAAVVTGQVEGDRIGVVVCGGNTDPGDLARGPSGDSMTGRDRP